MRYEELWPDMRYGEKRDDEHVEILKGNRGPCLVCDEDTQFWDTAENCRVCSQECQGVLSLHTMMCFTGAGCRLEEMPGSEVLAIFRAWTPEQRQEAEEYFVNVQDGAMAGERLAVYPRIVCPEHLKPYGCPDMAEQEAYD